MPNSPGCDSQLGAEYSATDFRQLNRDRTIFPNTMGVLKTLYLVTWDPTKKNMPVHNWGQVYAEQDIMYLGRQTRN